MEVQIADRTAEVELSREVAEDALKAAVKAAGYEYGGMKG